MALTDLAVKKANKTGKPEKRADGGGLYVLVQPDREVINEEGKKKIVPGARYWRLAYRFAGKQKTLALGVYPDVPLAGYWHGPKTKKVWVNGARDLRDDARKLLANGAEPSSPGAEKKKTKQATEAATANGFETLAREYHKMKSPMWTEGHAKQWLGNMETYAFPVIGDRQIDKIEPMEIIGILREMEKNKTFETRDRLGQSIGSVFKYAIATGLAKYNPAAEIRMALADRPKVEHFPCITTPEIPAFLRALSAYEDRGKVSPIAISAIRLMMLTATRTSEVRYSKWVDFNLDAGAWIIPAEQKGRKGKGDKRRDHAVPLSTQAVAILRGLHPITGQGEFAFPNRNTTGRVISENTALKIIETIGYGGKMTGHGLRSLARTVLGDMGHRWEVLEAMLSHAIANQTAAAYVRTSYFEERKVIMQQWADYLDSVEQGAQVIPLRANSPAR